MLKVSFLVDGFNLYHSVISASYKLGFKGKGTKWLDIHAWLRSYLPRLGRRYNLAEIIYFSAYAYHMEASDPGTVARHRLFIQALEATGIKTEMHSFQKKKYLSQGRIATRREEKETDVAMGVRLLELFMKKRCDFVFMVTGDTDLIPAIMTAHRLFPKKPVSCVFPFARVSPRMRKIVYESYGVETINAKPKHYQKHQFDDPLILPDGTELNKPPPW